MLYQLSYASSFSHRKAFWSPKERTDTLPFRAYYGTVVKVSIAPQS